MADFRAAIAVRQAMGDAATVLVDAGSGPGVLKIYAGPVPGSVNDALSGQTLLAALTLSDPAFGPTDGQGIATANPIAAANTLRRIREPLDKAVEVTASPSDSSSFTWRLRCFCWSITDPPKGISRHPSVH